MSAIIRHDKISSYLYSVIKLRIESQNDNTNTVSGFVNYILYYSLNVKSDKKMFNAWNYEYILINIYVRGWNNTYFNKYLSISNGRFHQSTDWL